LLKATPPGPASTNIPEGFTDRKFIGARRGVREKVSRTMAKNRQILFGQRPPPIFPKTPAGRDAGPIAQPDG
jgi:hypothetical protein